MPSTKRPKAFWRWVVVVVSGVATTVFLGAVVNGPQPTHASPPPTPVVVQQAPSLDQMIAQDRARAESDDDGFGGAGSFAQASGPAYQPRLRTRGS